MNSEKKSRISLSSPYAERVLTVLTDMQSDRFLVDSESQRADFKKAVDEIIELGLDRKRGFILEYNSKFTIVYKQKP
jgi:hypothetical protein